jgi:hypothetical protein
MTFSQGTRIDMKGDGLKKEIENYTNQKNDFSTIIDGFIALLNKIEKLEKETENKDCKDIKSELTAVKTETIESKKKIEKELVNIKSKLEIKNFESEVHALRNELQELQERYDKSKNKR